jgi:hypothetical protein
MRRYPKEVLDQIDQESRCIDTRIAGMTPDAVEAELAEMLGTGTIRFSSMYVDSAFVIRPMISADKVLSQPSGEEITDPWLLDRLRRMALRSATKESMKRRWGSLKAVQTRKFRAEEKIAKMLAELEKERAARPSKLCRMCWRRLSDPASRERGIGPECWGKLLGLVSTDLRDELEAQHGVE